MRAILGSRLCEEITLEIAAKKDVTKEQKYLIGPENKV